MHPHPCVSACKKNIHMVINPSEPSWISLGIELRALFVCVAVEIELGSRETMEIMFFERLQFGPEHLVFPG